MYAFFKPQLKAGLLIAVMALATVAARNVCAQNNLPAASTSSTIQNNRINSPVYLEPGRLKEDLSFMHRNLESTHPGLYRYKTKKELDHLFDSCTRKLDLPMSGLDFAKIVSFIISTIEDGHTGSGITRMLLDSFSEKEPMFPVFTYFVGGQCYALCSEYPAIPPGTEIMTIDHVPVASIREELFKHLPSDGKILTKKQQILNNGAFPFLYRWIYAPRQSFLVTYRQAGTLREARLPARVLKNDECNAINDQPPLKSLVLTFLPEKRAMLTIRSFDDRRLGNQNFKKFLDSAFVEIRSGGTKALLIDLRGNGGGRDEYGALLYSYLAEHPFSYFLSIKTTEKTVSESEDSLLGPQQPNKNRFQGKVFLLINGTCFSTTADFCAIVKSNNRGTFIGEETGGGYYGNTSGETARIQLPNSRIDIIIPKFKYVNSVRRSRFSDRGTMPDHIIIPGVNDLLYHRDVVLEFALSLSTKWEKSHP